MIPLYLCQKFSVCILIGHPLDFFGCPVLCISLFILMHSFCYCRRKICRAGEMACASVRTRHCNTSSCGPSVLLMDNRRWGQGNQLMLRGQVAYLTASGRAISKTVTRHRTNTWSRPPHDLEVAWHTPTWTHVQREMRGREGKKKGGKKEPWDQVIWIFQFVIFKMVLENQVLCIFINLENQLVNFLSFSCFVPFLHLIYRF